MTKESLFLKYNINSTHHTWDYMIDNWMSVELYRVMNDGKLPDGKQKITFALDFLEKVKNNPGFVKVLMETRGDFGSLYLTAKRMIYRYSDEILKELETTNM